MTFLPSSGMEISFSTAGMSFTFGVTIKYPRVVTSDNAVQKVELFFSSFKKVYADFESFHFLTVHQNI
jgi:hypothetical protein